MTYKPVYKPNRPAMAATTEDLYAVSPLTSVCTPDSFSMHSSCFSSCQSPETADPSDLWTSRGLLFATSIFLPTD